MYPPPHLDVLRELKDSPIYSISFGLYVVHLTFENGNRLSLAAPFRFENGNDIQNSDVFEFPLQETKIIRLIGGIVKDVECDADGTLDIIFGNGDRLVIYANNPMYEAYTLLINGQEYVV